MTLSLQFDLTQEKNLLQIDFPWHFIFGNSYFLPSPLSCLSPTFFKKSESKSHQSVTIVTSTIEYSLQVSKLDFFPPCDIKDSLLVTDKIWQYSKQWAKSCAKMVYLINFIFIHGWIRGNFWYCRIHSIQRPPVLLELHQTTKTKFWK